MSTTRFGKVLETLHRLPAAEQPTAPVASPPRRIGRPRGKKSNPNFVQVTVYVRRDTHMVARQRLYEEGKELSQLVQELVADWLRRRPEGHQNSEVFKDSQPAMKKV